MFQLLNLWTEYVEIIYMPESDIHTMELLQKTEGRLDEESKFMFKRSEQNIQNRLNTLFGKDKD